MKITVIGAGNIGGAVAAGLCRSNKIQPSDLTVTARHAESLERFKKLGCRTTTDNTQAVKDADVVMFAVKPWLMEEVCCGVAAFMDVNRQIVVSIAPGVTSEKLCMWFGTTSKLMYAIPNTAAEINQSMTYIAPVTAGKDDIEKVRQLFEYVGTVQIVDNSLMLPGTSLASCGIAYALRYISASIQGGVDLGFDRASATESVCQTVQGAVSLLMQHGGDPENEINKVTTPGGLTLRGLAAMEMGGFSTSVRAGLNALNSKK